MALSQGKGRLKLLQTLSGFTISATVYKLLTDELQVLMPDQAQEPPSPRPPDQRVSLLTALRLWRKLQRTYDGSDLGILMARSLTPQKANLIGSLFMQSRNLRESVELMRRYLTIATDNVSIDYQEQGDEAVFSFTITPRSLLPYSVTEFYMFTCCFWAMRYCSCETLPVTQASFSFKSPPHVAFYHTIAPEARLIFGQKHNSIRLKRAFFYQDNPNHSPSLEHLITGHAEPLMASYHQEHTVSMQVLKSIQQQLPHALPTTEEVAAELNMSARTLSRHLQAEGVGFRELLELVKKEIAGSMIADTDLLIEEIAFLLGYNEYSSFSRAFKKWYGVSPAAYRRRLADDTPQRGKRGKRPPANVANP